VYPPNEDYPHGYAMNLADGLLRLRYRDSFEKAEFMEPGRIYEVEMNSDLIGVTSNYFAPGHRIRLDISSSNFPAFDPNPNTGAVRTVSSSASEVAQVSIFHDKLHPSRLIVPTINGRRP
jgi:uncharacterized protein